MGAFLRSLNGLETVFLACAALGFVLLVVRLLMQFVGGDGGDADADVDVDVDVDVDAGMDADVSFRLLSLQGLTGFFLMFGLVGLALSKESGAGHLGSLVGAFVAGLLTLVGMAKFMAYLKSFQSSGTVKFANAVGQEGSVYLTIPSDGTGKVQVSVQERLLTCDAVSIESDAVKTGERVRVVRITGGNVLVVERLL